MRSWFLLPLTCSLACGVGDPDPAAAPPRPALNVTTTPTLGGRAVSTSQLELRGELDATTVALVRGDVSDVALGSLAGGQLPSSVAARAVAIEVSPTETGVVVRARAPLAAERHTLAVGAPRTRVTLDVAPGPPLARVALSRDLDVVLCVDGPAGELVGVGAAPSTVLAGAPGAPDDRCFTVTRPLPAALARADGTLAALVPPSPPASPRAASTAACDPPRVALGRACADVEDDRLVVRGAPSPSLLWLDVGGVRLRAALDGSPTIVRGLAADAALGARAIWVPFAGDATSSDVTLRTGPALARAVLTEALADPLGPEPDAEWIELTNDGALPLDLTGYALRDSAGAAPLPSAVVAPYSRVLLVTPRFVPTTPPPPEGCRMLTLPSLGKNGLSNDGEALELLRPDGSVESRLPAAKARAGWSVSRELDRAFSDAVATGPPTPCAP